MTITSSQASDLQALRTGVDLVATGRSAFYGA
jgi:hypothetical protein